MYSDVEEGNGKKWRYKCEDYAWWTFFIVLLVLIAIGSWQINTLNKEKSKCSKKAFTDVVNGKYLGNDTVQYITNQQYHYCTIKAEGLIKDQLVLAYKNYLNECQLTPTNCDNYEGKVTGWGFGIAFSIVFLLVGCTIYASP
jgi:hypothetical protein